jgi:serine/threonine protein kinase
MRLEWDDLFVEELLGVGGFASVYLATCPKLWQRQNKGSDNMENSSSVFSHDHSWALSGRSGTSSGTSMMSGMSLDESTAELTGAYAVKYLSNRTMADPKQYATGARDLAGEAFLLSRLSHPNIIQLYGVTAGDVSDAFTKRGGLFLVLEALVTTLTQELHAWRKTPLASLDDFVKQNQQSSVPSTSGRLDIAAEIAKGMHYLHSHDIIFRDLKPDNVGFDRAGGVRLFDFGLAREVNKKENRLNGVAGSMMYLAPETVLGKYSCKSSDVYSFGILLWELMSLERPFPEFDQPNQLQKAVSIDGHRPNLSSMPERVAALIRSCWQSNHDARPSFLDIIPSLRALKQFRKQKRVLSDA